MIRIFFYISLMLVIALGGCATNEKQMEAVKVPNSKFIAFTFDDGPSEKTEQLLHVLKENNIKATFFLIGQNIRSRPDFIRMIFADGHEIGNHSNGYNSLGVNSGADENTIRESLVLTSVAISEIIGTEPLYFRAPNLDYGATLAKVVTEMNMSFIGTDIIGFDWESTVTTEQIVNNILNSAKDGGIILLHERHEGDLERTIRAVPLIVRELRARGYEFLTVGELAQKNRITLEAGKRYDIMKY